MIHTRTLIALAMWLTIAPLYADVPADFRPTIAVDVAESPELAEWSDQAKKQCETWFPKLVKEFDTDGHKPAETVTLFFKKDMDGVAHTSGRRIVISSKWVTDHPDDIGMVIHELMHVVQAYPPSKAGWLVEGIADYVRYFQFEPDKKSKWPINAKSSYKQGYGVTAAFLAWLERTKHPGIVLKLNAALRTSKYDNRLFEELTGRSLDDLWAEFVAQGGKVPETKPEQNAK
ncbi:MAG TPA: basic secretory protein-like protein [Planctomycetaceae bacterium]|nr:basic secretory protein-like protein [Planctomycetaceae bacterium]